MATPRNVSRTTAAGTKLRAGRFTPAYVNLVDQIAAAPPNSWVKVNLNRYEDVWEHPAFRAQYSDDLNPTTHAQLGGSSPRVVIAAWCSFGWDDDRMRLVLFGGGHANGSNNEVYMWSGETQTWSIAYHAHTVQAFDRTNAGGGIRHRSIAGSKNAPISAHTYSNQVWLPKLQRFYTGGGAAYNTGGAWMIDVNGLEVRQAGPFCLDMTLAGQGYVSTGTGTNPQRTGTISEGVSRPGANAWYNRDYRLDHPNTSVAEKLTGGRTLCVTEENGHDVVYTQGGSPGATSKDLLRIEMVDHDYRNDIISIVGGTWSNGVSDVQAAFDPTRKLFFNPAYTSPTANDFIGGWDVSPGKAGSQNRYFLCHPDGLSGPDKAEFVANASQTKYGNIYDERRDRFIVFSRMNALFELKPPAGTNYSTGWAVKKIAGASEFAQLESEETSYDNYGPSLCGRWKRSKKLDVYILLTHAYDGQIWMFKPHDWLDPRTA